MQLQRRLTVIHLNLEKYFGTHFENKFMSSSIPWEFSADWEYWGDDIDCDWGDNDIGTDCP